MSSPVFAEPIAHVGNFSITNSMIMGWASVFIILFFSILIGRRVKLVPKGAQNILEMLMEAFMGIADAVTGNREKTLKLFPFVFTFFILILMNNWLGILPGVGSIGMIEKENGENIFIPFLRGGTADVNATLALAILGVVASHVFGVVSIGIWDHLNKFINIKAVLEIPKKAKKDLSILLVNPIKVFVGLIEIISEFAKVASLSFRLFGNVFAGEVLLATMAGIFAFGLPLPFLFLEVLVGLIQAFIFAILVLSYLSMASQKEEH